MTAHILVGPFVDWMVMLHLVMCQPFVQKILPLISLMTNLMIVDDVHTDFVQLVNLASVEIVDMFVVAVAVVSNRLVFDDSVEDLVVDNINSLAAMHSVASQLDVDSFVNDPAYYLEGFHY
jgi:hypothetical protein